MENTNIASLRQVTESKQMSTLNELKQMKQSLGLSTKNLSKIVAASSGSGKANNDSAGINNVTTPRGTTNRLKLGSGSAGSQLNDSNSNNNNNNKQGTPFSSDSGNNKFTNILSPGNEGVTEYDLRAEIYKVTKERDSLIEKKREWVKFLQAKNVSLEQSLADVEAKKSIIVQYIKEIQEDKRRRDARTRSNRYEARDEYGNYYNYDDMAQIDELLVLLREDNIFAPNFRSNIPEDRLQRCVDIQASMEQCVPSAMAHMLDVVDEVRSLVESMQEAFQNNSDDDLELLVMQLQELSYRGPNNFKTVKGINESLVNLTIGQSDEDADLNSDANKEALKNITLTYILDNLATSNSIELQGSVEQESLSSTDAWREILSGNVQDTNVLNELVSNLLATNDNLKKKIGAYQVRNNNLRNEINQTVLKLQQNEDEVNQMTGNQAPAEEEVSEPIEFDPTHFVPLYDLWNNMFESIRPSNCMNIIWSLLLSHVQKVVSGHPMTSRLPVIYVHAVVSEVSMNIRGILGKFVSESLGSHINLFDDSDEMAQAVEKLIRSGELEMVVKKCLQSIVVHNEIICLITFFFSYLSREYGKDLEDAAQTSTSASITAPSPQQYNNNINNNNSNNYNTNSNSSAAYVSSMNNDDRFRSSSSQSVSSVSRSEYNLSLLKSPNPSGSMGGRGIGRSGDDLSPDEKDIMRLVPKKDVPNYMRQTKKNMVQKK